MSSTVWVGKHLANKILPFDRCTFVFTSRPVSTWNTIFMRHWGILWVHHASHSSFYAWKSLRRKKKKSLACWVQYYSLVVHGIQLSGTNYMMSLILDDLQESTISEDSNHLLFGVNWQLGMLFSHILKFLYHPLPLWFPLDQQLDLWRAMNNTLTTSYYF